MFFSFFFPEKDQAINIASKLRRVSHWGICTAGVRITRHQLQWLIQSSSQWRLIHLQVLIHLSVWKKLGFQFLIASYSFLQLLHFLLGSYSGTLFLSLHADVLMMMPGFLRDDWWWLKCHSIKVFLWLEQIARTCLDHVNILFVTWLLCAKYLHTRETQTGLKKYLL